MSKAMVEVQVRALAETSGGCAAFLGNGEKIFVMLVDRGVGTAIALALQGTPPERPRTHDLIANILRGLDAKVERVIVNDFKRSCPVRRATPRPSSYWSGWLRRGPPAVRSSSWL